MMAVLIFIILCLCPSQLELSQFSKLRNHVDSQPFLTLNRRSSKLFSFDEGHALVAKGFSLVGSGSQFIQISKKPKARSELGPISNQVLILKSPPKQGPTAQKIKILGRRLGRPVLFVEDWGIIKLYRADIPFPNHGRPVRN